MRGQYRTLIWLSFWATFVLAQLQSFTFPGQNEITYSVNIPEQTALSGKGPIFIQLKSTREVQWFAWGQGARMQGANIFVVYAAGDNVTVSPRLGVEHVEPLYNPQAQVSILDGSGVHNGIITANIRCDSCITWPGGHEDVTSSSSPWVWAVKYGASLNTNSVSAAITMHDNSGLASLNLKQATGGSSDNPFAAASGTPNTSSGQATITFNSPSIRRRRIAHATIMIVAFVILFPLFALGIQLFPSSRTVNTHACLQIFTLLLSIAGFGIGISMATSLQLTSSYHPIIGIVVISCLALFQPAMGLLQHRYFGRTGKKGPFAYLHRWFGRAIITLGIINAGLGFRLTGIGSSLAPVGAVIAYGIVAGIVWLSYALVVVLLPFWKRRSPPS
ncbi:hypothetical protein BDV59DRAFT_207073 [Aspergillus ambiguus]|uniref:cytochrome and DOMON domain-containing protein n=1 Tax=Aspergillus ambiguus TaxID=176160 RepID=UPI003CCDDE27